MPRTIRVIAEGQVYEVVPRAKNGLPLPPNQLTNTVLSGIIGRCQRYEEVTLSNFCLMNNHSHLQLITNVAHLLPKFLGELLKKTTDSVRAMLGFRSLRLWEDRASIILVPDLEDSISRLVYIFTNPTKAGMVDTIDEYPGLSSWNAFVSCPASLDAEVRTPVHWYPVAALPLIPRSGHLTDNEASRLCEQIALSTERVEAELVVKPFAWLAPYGVSDPTQIEAIRQRVISGVRELEAQYRAARAEKNQTAIGAKRLRLARYMEPHTPKRRDRKIFLICSNKEARIKFLGYFRDIFSKCRECYELAKSGATAIWPPGTFIPWLPPTAGCEFDCGWT